jgi:hypothetical protein
MLTVAPGPFSGDNDRPATADSSLIDQIVRGLGQCPAVLPLGFTEQSSHVRTHLTTRLNPRLPWRNLPPSFGVTVPTAHRRFAEWTKAGLWRRLHHAVLDELGGPGLIDWSRAVCDGASVRAKKGLHDRPQPRGPR